MLTALKNHELLLFEDKYSDTDVKVAVMCNITTLQTIILCSEYKSCSCILKV